MSSSSPRALLANPPSPASVSSDADEDQWPPYLYPSSPVTSPTSLFPRNSAPLIPLDPASTNPLPNPKIQISNLNDTR